LGAAVKGFKSAMSEGETEEKAKQLKQDKDADFTPSTAAPSAAARESDAKVPPKTQA
jgi:Sec-independent protein translocase protein TatA